MLAARFEPLEGERLEHLASRRGGPLRWAAGLVLSIQAQRMETIHPDAPSEPQLEADGAGHPPADPLTRRRRRTPAELRRSVLRRGGALDLRPLETVTDLTAELLALVRDGLGAASPRYAPLAATAGAGPAGPRPPLRRLGGRPAGDHRPRLAPDEEPTTAREPQAEDAVPGAPPLEAAGVPPVEPAVAPPVDAAVPPPAEADPELAPATGPVAAADRPTGLTRAGRAPRRAVRSRVPRPTQRVIDADVDDLDLRTEGSAGDPPEAAPSPAPAPLAPHPVPAADAAAPVPTAADAPAPAPVAAARPAAAAPAPAPVPAPATPAPARVEITAADEATAPEAPATPRPVAQISGWIGTQEDEDAWEAWLSDPVATDQNGQLAALGADLARPLPAPLRLAQRFGRRRREEDPLPIDD